MIERRSSAPPPTVGPFEPALAAVVAEARSQVRAGGALDRSALEARVRAAAAEERARTSSGDEREAVDRAERAALAALERVAAVRRAFDRLASPPPSAPRAAAPATPGPGGPGRSRLLRARPTITGTMDVRRAEVAGEATIVWDPVPAVRTWEVRLGRRPDPRSGYVTVETLVLPADVTQAALPLDEHPLRVTVIGQARRGRPVRQAIVSALTAANWNDRWERRATAS